MQNLSFPKYSPDTLGVSGHAGDLTITANSNKRIKEHIEKVSRELKWKIEYVQGQREGHEIEFDDENRKHIVYVPNDKDQFYYLDILHELGHATLYEKLRFGDGWTPKDTDEYNIFASIIRLLDDWFVIGWLMELVPDAVAVEIETACYCEMGLLQSQRSIHVPALVRAALSFAMCIKFLRWKMSFGKDLQKVVDAFVSVSPYVREIGNAERLANGLLEACPGIGFRVKASRWDGADVRKGNLLWDFIGGNGGKSTVAPGATLDLSVSIERKT